VVRISLKRLSVPEHLLVSLTITLPPVVSQSMNSWRVQCGWLTPIWAPMSDTVRRESIEQDKSNEKLHLRLAHFQGSGLELLHIGVPVYLLVTYKHDRGETLVGLL
jgi:hypothetical protein